MVLEIILLLGFQILEGFVYTQLALIIACFMAGMALGAGFVAALSSRIGNPIRWLIVIQSILALYILGTLGLFFLLQQQLQTIPIPQDSLPLSVIFSLLALTAGVLGGIHFSLCVRAVSDSPSLSTTSGPKLYALDLIGATVGVLGASLFILPIYGLTTTMLALVMCCVAGVLVLMRSAANGGKMIDYV
jgi:spermidine synthase